MKKLDKIWDKQESRVSKIWSDFSHLFNFFQKNFSVHDPDEYENEYISREEKVIVNMEKAQKKIFEKIRQLRPNLEDEVNCAQQKYIEERHQIFLKNYNIEK